MKILYFIDTLAAGGKERRLVELMKRVQSKSSIEYQLVIMSKIIHYQEVFDLHIKIHYLIRNSKYDISIFYKFYQICKNFKPDIVHCWDSMTAVISGPICVSLNIKLANGMVVDTPVKRNVFNKIWFRAKLTFPFSSIIIGNSEAGLVAYKAPKKKSYCIYNGLDFSRFDNLKDSEYIRKLIFGDGYEDIFIVGMVAAFEKRKDYKTFISAAEKLISNFDNIRFVLVGDGANFSKIKRSVSQSNLDKFFFLGKRSDVESIVNIFDIGVLLTNSKVHGEGLSNSILEYMALGKPVIASSGGGTNEIVEDKRTGFVISSLNPKELAKKIEMLLRDDILRTKMGFAGRKKIYEMFSIDSMTHNLVCLYEKCLTLDTQ